MLHYVWVQIALQCGAKPKEEPECIEIIPPKMAWTGEWKFKIMHFEVILCANLWINLSKHSVPHLTEKKYCLKN